VVVLVPPDSEVRLALPAKFKERFGITLEYIGGRGCSTSARMAFPSCRSTYPICRKRSRPAMA
jgi:hypothetical protein